MRIRFTLRDLLWLTVVVGLAVGWWLDHKGSKFQYLFDVQYWTIGFGFGCFGKSHQSTREALI
jgi:hypothetical protein